MACDKVISVCLSTSLVSEFLALRQASTILKANDTRMSFCEVSSKQRIAKIFEGKEDLWAQETSIHQLTTFPSLFQHPSISIIFHHFPSTSLIFTSFCKETHPIVAVFHVPRGRGSASTARERGIPTSQHPMFTEFTVQFQDRRIELPMCRKYWDTTSICWAQSKSLWYIPVQGVLPFQRQGGCVTLRDILR